jgi:CheY-like chemotaxis protein
MDVRLPGKDGVECLLEIHRAKPDAKVVIMTGYTVEHLLDMAKTNGAWLTLHKPLDTSRVLEMIQVIAPCGGVLIADDDPDFAESLREFLEARRYRVFVAHDGQQALDYLRTHDDVDVLILDLKMPVKTGLEVLQELKEEGRSLPTIVVTGCPIEEVESQDIMRFLEVVGVLIKPFDPEDLVRLLGGVMGSDKELPQCKAD